VVRLDADLLDLDRGMVLPNVAQLLRQKVFEGPLEDPPPVLRNPDEVVLVMIRSLGAQPDLPAAIISKNRPAEPAQPPAGGFHPRADARGPQPQV